MTRELADIPASGLVCTHQFHSNPKYPDRIPDEAYIESHCKVIECSFLEERQEGVVYAAPPEGTVFYKNNLPRK